MLHPRSCAVHATDTTSYLATFYCRTPLSNFFSFSSRRRHTRLQGDWGSDVCSSDLPAPLVIAAQDKTKPYGAALPPLTATYSGFVGGEGTSVLGGTLQLTTEATAASRVDDYRITPSGLTSNNYDIEFVDGIVKVTPAALTVRAAAAEKVYGAMLPEFTVVYEGFVLGETAASLDGSLEFDTDATASSAVGVYQVTPKGLHSRNYTIAFVPGVLAIVRAALTVRADDTSKLYGAPLPTFTARFEGFEIGRAHV